MRRPPRRSCGGYRSSEPDKRRTFADGTGVGVVLSRREGALLLRHPATWIGTALAAAGFAVAVTSVGEAAVLGDPLGWLGASFSAMVGFGVTVAALLGALRSRRSGTEELYGSVPTSARARTAAHLGSLLATVPISAAVVLSLVWLLSSNESTGTFGLPALVLPALLVLGGGASGVLVARWVPSVFAAPAAIIAIFVLQANLGYDHPRWRWLHFADMDVSPTPLFDVRHDGLHVVYIAGLILLAVALALARDGLSRPVVALGATALLVVAATGWVTTRPPTSAQAAARADLLERPARHQACSERGGVTYCAYAGYEGWVGPWAQAVSGALGNVPAGSVAEGLVVRQRPTQELYGELAPEVRRVTDPEQVWTGAGEVHPSMQWHASRGDLPLAYAVTATAVGLRTDRGWGEEACSAGGQARVVVALVLAGLATPDAAGALRDQADRVEGAGPGALVQLATVGDDESLDASGSSLDIDQASAGRGADLVAAATLLEDPAADASPDGLAESIAAGWDRLVDPATPAAEVFEFLEVPVPAVLDRSVPATPGVGGACP